MTVNELVARERKRLGRILGIWGVARAVGVVATLLAIAALALGGGRWMTLPAAVPFVAWFLVVAAVVGLGAHTVRGLRRDASTGRVTAAIESERQLRRGALRGALEVAHLGALGRRGARDLAARLQAGAPGRRAPLAPRLRRRARRHAAIGAGLAALAVATLAAAAATEPAGWSAVRHPIRAWRGTLLPALRIDAPRDVPRGHEARIRIAAAGRRRIAVYTRVTGAPWGGDWYTTRAERVDLRTGPVTAEMAVVATDGRATSDTVVIRASDRPFVGAVTMRAVYPAYLHRADEALAAGEVARVPRATRIEISGQASAPLQAIALVRGRDTVTLRPDGRRFAGRLLAEIPGQWAWSATSDSGAVTDVPPAIELDVIPDSAPRVDIVDPAHDTTVTPADQVPLSITASDDHALASVVVRSWRTGPGAGGGAGEAPPVVQRVSDSAVAQWAGVVTLSLAGRGLAPGDAMHVVAQATDASPWHQVTQSRELVLRVPSLAEERTLARASADSAVSAATATAAAQRQLEQRTEEAARARGARTGPSAGSTSGSANRSALSYESAERAKALANEQRQLGDRVQQVQRQTQELERQLKQAGALDSALASELHQAQQLLNDALTPELRDQLSKLDQSADSLRGGDTRQSLEQLAQQQQQLRSQLERSVEVLKRAALEGAMQTLRDEARDIAKEERSRAGTPSAPSPAQLAAKQPPAGAQQGSPPAGAVTPRPNDSAPGRTATRPGEQVGGQPGQRLAQQADSAERENAQNAQSAQNAPRPDSPARAGEQSRTGPGAERDAERESRRNLAQMAPEAADRARGDRTPASADPQRGKPGSQPESQSPLTGRRPSPEELAERSRALSRDVDQLAHRLAAEQAQSGAQRVGAARQHVDSSAQAMSQRQAGPAASEMDRAAQQLGDARQAQIQEWKSALTQELDRSIQETQQLARQENDLAQRTQQGVDRREVQSEQSAVQQGAQRTGERLQRASRQTALVSGTTQRALGQARSQVENATRQAEQEMPSGSSAGQQAGAMSGGQSPGSQQTAAAMRTAADALNQAAAALMRDRERAGSASSASGLAEMLAEMQQLAKAQGSLNAQAQGLSLNPGGSTPGGTPSATARAVAEGQRRLAESLDRIGDNDMTGRAQGLASEAHQLADALARSGIDQQTLVRQQRLYHRLLDAGLTLENDERDSTGKRVAQSATGREQFTPPSAPVDGRAAQRFREPAWSELRGLSADERQLVLEYFRRLNAQSAP